MEFSHLGFSIYPVLTDTRQQTTAALPHLSTAAGNGWPFTRGEIAQLLFQGPIQTAVEAFSSPSHKAHF